MAKAPGRPESECCDGSSNCRSFKVEAIVSVDERGQMVLPKDLRARSGIGAGEKLALISWEREGEVCCLSLVKADAFGELVGELLGPMVGQLKKD